MNYQQQFIELLYSLPAILIAVILHEYAHGLVSVWLGDDTPRRQGRLSLNPLHHLDPIGVICLAVFKFGWAKPVQINPGAYRNRKAGTALVALAGPMMNFLLAFAGCILYGLLWKLGFFLRDGFLVEMIYSFLVVFMSINLGLGVFNLIPIPPLDGSRILGVILPRKYYYVYMRLERYGTFLLMAIILIENFLQVTLLPIGVIKSELWSWMLDAAFKLLNI